MKFYEKRTVSEQLRRLPLNYRENYSKVQLDRISIDGEVLQGYFEYSFLEEKSYIEQPTRAIDGSIGNIDDIPTILTPRVMIKYNMMHIDDYRTLMKKLKSKNSFNVTCYDVVEDKMVTHQMYAATPQMPIIYQQYLMALGINEYSIELIGTNNEINSSEPDVPFPPTETSYLVNYDYNLPASVKNPFSSTSYSQRTDAFGGFVVGAYDNDVLVGNTDIFSIDGTKGYKFEGWLNDSGTSIYKNGETLSITSNTTLQAVWSEYSIGATTYTLVMNTGSIYNAIQKGHKFYYADTMELLTDDVLQSTTKKSNNGQTTLGYKLTPYDNKYFGDVRLLEEDPNLTVHLYTEWIFKGWSIDVNNASSTLYANGQSIALNKPVTTAYMQWRTSGVIE